MDKQDLIRMAEELHRGAFDANAYFLILQQYQLIHWSQAP